MNPYSTRNSMFLFSIMAVLMSFMLLAVPHASQSAITESEGYACMGADFSRKETEKAAMTDARRKAAEQALTYIKSETQVKNFELEKDLVDAYARAAVTVLDTKSSSWYKDSQAGDCYKVMIKAEVVPDAEGLNMVAQKSGKSEGLSFNLNYVYRAKGTGDLKPIKKGDILQSGDHYKIIFSPDRDSYVYIFQVDSSGQIFQLFPMQRFRGVALDNHNPVRSGRTYILPAGDKAFTLDRQSGIERIYFIASKERNPEVERLYADIRKNQAKPGTDGETAQEKLKRFFGDDAGDDQGKTVKTASQQTGGNAVDKVKVRFRKRGVEGIATDTTMDVPWKESGDLFSVVGQKLEGFGEDSLHVLEFVHQ